MQKINERKTRERAAIFLCLVAVLYSVWDETLNSPLITKQQTLITELNNKNAERLVLNNRLQDLIAKQKQDPDADNRARLEALTVKLQELENALDASTQNLVKPEQMPKLLETVLVQTDGLTLNNIKSLGVTALIEEVSDKQTSSDSKQSVDSSNIASAFRHGIRIEFSGDYFSTLNYMQKLEALEWGFFWDNFSLDVDSYPDTRATIEIFTLSLSREWIGV